MIRNRCLLYNVVSCRTHLNSLTVLSIINGIFQWLTVNLELLQVVYYILRTCNFTAIMVHIYVQPCIECIIIDILPFKKCTCIQHLINISTDHVSFVAYRRLRFLSVLTRSVRTKLQNVGIRSNKPKVQNFSIYILTLNMEKY